MGKPGARGDGMLKAVAERNPRSDTAVPSEARAGAPTQEGRPRAPWRGGRSRRRSPTRATAETGPPTDKGRETAGNGPERKGEHGDAEKGGLPDVRHAYAHKRRGVGNDGAAEI